MDELFDSQEPGTYSTGSTKPPKKSGCLFAFLLMLLIFSVGIISSLGLFNIPLRRIEVSDPNETVSIVVSDPVEKSNLVPTIKTSEHKPLGITGENVPLVYQSYYRLPNGLLVTGVIPGSTADLAGIVPGDILLQVNYVPVTDAQEFENALGHYALGDTIILLVYRNGKQYSIPVIFG